MEQLKEDDLASGYLLFTIVSVKENIVVLGTAESAIEIKFFDGGYRYTAFVSAEAFSKAFESF